MAVREQLAKQVAAIRAGTAETTRLFYTGRYQILRVWEIRLECRCRAPRMSVTWDMQGRVNATEFSGAAAGHLLFGDDRSRVEYPCGLPVYWIAVQILYSDRPWNSPGLLPCPFAKGDFESMLAALEAEAVPSDVPPARPETWHDLPPML